jgi:hypothetical protein
MLFRGWYLIDAWTSSGIEARIPQRLSVGGCHVRNPYLVDPTRDLARGKGRWVQAKS